MRVKQNYNSRGTESVACSIVDGGEILHRSKANDLSITPSPRLIGQFPEGLCYQRALILCKLLSAQTYPDPEPPHNLDYQNDWFKLDLWEKAPLWDVQGYSGSDENQYFSTGTLSSIEQMIRNTHVGTVHHCQCHETSCS